MIGDEMQQPFPLRMMGYSAIYAGNLVRARALIKESLKGNRSQGHIPGQLACLVALGTCASVEGNIQKSITLAALVDHYLHTDAQVLMEPDAAALRRLFATGNEKLDRELLEQTLMTGRTLHIEDIVAQELPSAG
jgi:hypothetical protein